MSLQEYDRNVDDHFIHKNMSRIIRYLKISRDLKQSDLARIMNCSRTKVSRIESQLAQPSIMEWHHLTEAFNLSVNAYMNSKVFLDSEDDLKAFNISLPYNQDVYSKGPVLDMHIEAFQSYMGPAAFEQFCEKEKVNPIYFVNFNNALNVNFNFRMLQSLISHKKIKNLVDLRNYAFRAIRVLNQSPCGALLKSKSGVERILSFFKNSSLYEENHEYKVFDCRAPQEALCGFRPKEHVDMSLYNSFHLRGVPCKFLNFLFLELAGPGIHSEEISCIHRNDPYCAFRYTDQRGNQLCL